MTTRKIEHCWIPMPDGVRLAARVWLPSGGPSPAILEYIPYRKRDMVRARDERNHPYFAENGFASLRVDMRGSGDSEGHMPDMYDPNELTDARHVIERIAAQSWCDGNVGMFGTSWGGTASLQAAIEAPIALKAVIANCATIDRFEDDIHWMGGCLLTDTLEWGATLPAILAAPPDAVTVGEGWLEQWKARLQALTFPLQQWITHATRRTYWRHGSVRFQAAKLTCPVLTIGGWADRYSNSVMRLADARPDLVWGIVGPWGHHYPDKGEPGPAIGFQELALDWWRHWLMPAPKALNWPTLRLWHRTFDPPQDRLEQRRGGWIDVDREANSSWRQFYLAPGALNDAPSVAGNCHVSPDIAHGTQAGDTGYFGRSGGLPLDQTEDDERALTCSTEPLVDCIDLIGAAELEIAIQRNQPAAQLVARICDVAPNGRSNLVTRAMLNLVLDEDLDDRVPFEPGEARSYLLQYPTAAYRFAQGHRLRLSVSASYWPLIWPELPLQGFDVLSNGTCLNVPSRTFGAMADGADLPVAKDVPTCKSWTSVADGVLERTQPELTDGQITSGWATAPTTLTYTDIDTEITTSTRAMFSHTAEREHAVSCSMGHEIRIQRADGLAKIDCQVEIQDAGGQKTVAGRLTANWNGQEIAVKNWNFTA